MRNLRIVLVVLLVMLMTLFSSCSSTFRAKKAAAAIAAAEKEEQERDKIAVGMQELMEINKGLVTLNEGMTLLLSKFPAKVESRSGGRISLMDLYQDFYERMKLANSNEPSAVEKELLGAMETVLNAERRLDSAWFTFRSVLEKYGPPTTSK